MYSDRVDAGRVLAEAVRERLGGTDASVLGLPRGGVPVAAEVARALAAPLDVVVVRKLGMPLSPEVAMGAIASVGGELAVVSNDDVPHDGWQDVLEHETAELRRRVREYRGDRPPLDVEGRTVVLVDDGIATGATMRAAADAVRTLEPARVVAAVPVALTGARQLLGASVDELICRWFPPTFLGVGQAYADFTQTTDAEVRRLLAG
ncbi:phosphoribosyltransferase [Gryllotalpicola ginsengisoli]|uniref:phosphoribosyltransferase n=1 Tax=Gryllotalpicola ginsengisoli TaxID=444608 RepID=UPI00052646AC|nr:phosphoribosyltransferase family protein [Gryllotalpicola ginsengisoli]